MKISNGVSLGVFVSLEIQLSLTHCLCGVYISMFMLNLSILNFTDKENRCFNKKINHYLNNCFCIPVNIEVFREQF